MLKATCTLVSLPGSPLSMSKPFSTQIKEGEAPDDFEEKNWREKMHTSDSGEVYIPAMSLKFCLADIAAFKGEKVKGKGQSTWTKNFVAGLLVIDPLNLGIKADTVKSERFYCHASGKRGSGTRVWRRFPMIPTWKADATIYILDPSLEEDPDRVGKYLAEAGRFIGLGRFRPRNGGMNGRFTVENWQTETVEEG